MPHLLFRVTGPHKGTLKRLARDGRNHKGAIEAALRGAKVIGPTYAAISPDKALASALVFQEQSLHSLERARQWVSKVDTLANQYQPELQSVTKVNPPPIEDITETLQDEGPPIAEYINSFHKAVSDRVNAIDYLFNHPHPGAGTSAQDPPDGPPPTRPLLGADGEQARRVEDVVEIVDSDQLSSPEEAIAVPSVAVHASVQIAQTRKTATLLHVFVASPGDLTEERRAIEQVIQEWNRQPQPTDRTVILVPQLWEEDAIPLVGAGLDGQAVINQQLVDHADIVFALFRSRLGAATPRHISGTAEEIERSIQRGIPVHVYRAKEEPPEGRDSQQYEELQKYVADLQKRGLIGTFRSRRELKRKAMNALRHDIHQILTRLTT